MRTLIFIAIVSIFISCSDSKPDLSAEKAEITNLLAQERKAHFDRDVELFMSEFSDSMISINKGTVKTYSEKENKERIGKYFGTVQFIKWDDVAAPIIRFSNDGSLAYAIVQKQVILSYPDAFGNNFTDTTNYAWLSVYRKQKEGWKVEANVSTNK